MISVRSNSVILVSDPPFLISEFNGKIPRLMQGLSGLVACSLLMMFDISLGSNFQRLGSDRVDPEPDLHEDERRLSSRTVMVKEVIQFPDPDSMIVAWSLGTKRVLRWSVPLPPLVAKSLDAIEAPN